MFIRAKARELKDGNTSYYFYVCWSKRSGSEVNQYSNYLTSLRKTNDFVKLREFWKIIIEKLEPYTDNMEKPSALYYVYEIEKKFNIPTSMSGTPLLENYQDYLKITKWINEEQEYS